MEFALLAFRLGYKPWPFFTPWFLSFGKEVYILCWSSHYILEADNSVWFHRFITRDQFCFRMNHSSSFTLVLFRKHLRWDLGLKELNLERLGVLLGMHFVWIKDNHILKYWELVWANLYLSKPNPNTLECDCLWFFTTLLWRHQCGP